MVVVTWCVASGYRDVQTGTALMAYKGNASRPGGCALVGREYMIASQTGKSLLHMWTWHKDQVHIKSFPPEQITALACSPDGGFCAGGGTSGAIHFWDVATGTLKIFCEIVISVVL